MTERRRFWTITVLLVLLSSSLSYYAGAAGLLPGVARLVGRPATQAQAQGLDMEQIVRVQQFIQDRLFFPVSSEQLMEGALKGMVQGTGDKYSAYFNPKEFQQFKEHFESTFSGIGVRVEKSPTTGLVTVVQPIKGSPGEKAGIQAGDAIVEVDGKDIRGLSLEEAVQLIRGPQGTKVKLVVVREGASEPLTFELTRATIEVPSTDHRMLDKEAGVGYLQIREFNENVSGRVLRALQELRAQGMTRLILDLRQNPGGLLDEAVDVASLFVPAKQPVVHIEYKGGKKETYTSSGKERFALPLVVLVDEYSASASEILAGAIKDSKIGVLMGKKTFGKGTVQTFYNLEGGAGIKLTTARYLTAGGYSIHEKGIEPDVTVENPKPVAPGDPGDVQLERALAYIKTMKP
jgi:carboxyl-terminal processing protease